MAKAPNEMSVITLPLKLEKWQIDDLNRIFHLCEQIYNNMLRYEMNQYKKMQQDERYIQSKTIIREAYLIKDNVEKDAEKKTERYKNAVKEHQAVMREYHMSEFSFKSDVAKFRAVYSDNVKSIIASRSIAQPMWTAFEKLEYGNGQTIHFKRNGDWKSIVSDGKSAIILKADGKTTHFADTDKKLVLEIRSRRTIFIPIDTESLNPYELEMLHRRFKTICVKRKRIKDSYQYSVAFTVEGPPAIKYHPKTGIPLHPVGEGRIGIYVDATSLTIAKPNGTFERIDLTWKNIYEDKIKELERYMEHSRRITNPENFNEDGTIKKAIIKNGRKLRLSWKNSKGYIQAKNKKADLQRKDKESKELYRQEQASYIISLGSDIVINDYAFKYAAMRKKYPEGEEKEEDGHYKKKRKKGSEIQSNAPAMLVSLIDSKLKNQGYPGVTKVKLEEISFDRGYQMAYAQKLLHV